MNLNNLKRFMIIINESSLSNLYQGFSHNSIDELLRETDIDNAMESLHSKIIDMFNLHFPIKPKIADFLP